MITDPVWLTVIVGAVAAVAGLAALWAVFKLFRPKLRARIDAARQAIRLDADNKGRASGWITKVAVVDGNLSELPTEFAGLAGNRFKAAELPGRTGPWYLVINSVRAAGPFPSDARVLVEWGRSRKRTLVPSSTDIAYYGQDSNWP